MGWGGYERLIESDGMGGWNDEERNGGRIQQVNAYPCRSGEGGRMRGGMRSSPIACRLSLGDFRVEDGGRSPARDAFRRTSRRGSKDYARPAPLAPRAGFGTSIFSPSDTARAYPIAAIVE